MRKVADFPVKSTGLKRKSSDTDSTILTKENIEPAKARKVTNTSTAGAAAKQPPAKKPAVSGAAVKAKSEPTAKPPVKKRPAWDSNVETQKRMVGIAGKDQLIKELEKKILDLDLKHADNVETISGDYEVRIKKTNAALSEAQDEADRLKARLDAAQKESDALRSTVAVKTATIMELESKVSLLEKKLKSSIESGGEKSESIECLQRQLNDSQDTVTELQTKLREEEQIRRRLHNTIQELKGNIRVFCRVRPPLDNELQGQNRDGFLSHFAFPDKDSREICLKSKTDSVDGTKTVAKNFEFGFDKVFAPDAKQADVFDEISQLVQSALDGYNVCVFAYGQTGSGKTFTMEGPESSMEDSEAMGMIPRAVLQIWNQTETLKSKGWQYVMEGSFVEIYNESVRDLLAEDGSASLKKKYEIKHILDEKRTFVTDAVVTKLSSPSQVIELLKQAAKNRKVAETDCNERSSRSHSVFMLRISGENALTGESCTGVLNLIDLAGSERLAQSGSTGDRLKETQAINKSLSALADVISALANKDSHIPYRNSKLTYLLQNSLGGNSKTLMFVNVAPSVGNFNETLCSLRFATKVNNCQIGTARKQAK